MPRKREKGPAFWRYSIAGMTAGVFGLFALAAFNAPPQTDPATFCRLDRRDPAHTMIVLDQSDPFNARDFGWVYSFVDAEARLLPKYGRLTVVAPNAERPYEPLEIYASCSPGSPDDANPVFQNPRMIEHRWRTGFYEPLKTQVELALTDAEAPASPLGETIFAIMDRADFQTSVKARRMVLVSDLMQNSTLFSFYKSGADLEAFAETRLADERPGMANVDVVARIVPRQEYDLPIADVKAFWTRYFAEAGATYSALN